MLCSFTHRMSKTFPNNHTDILNLWSWVRRGLGIKVSVNQQLWQVEGGRAEEENKEDETHVPHHHNDLADHAATDLIILHAKWTHH